MTVQKKTAKTAKTTKTTTRNAAKTAVKKPAAKKASVRATKAPAVITAHNRILAEGVCRNNDTRITGLNNNDLVIGPTGAGKTRGYVIPNLLHPSGESFIVADTKGNLHKAYGTHLRSLGYETAVIDFVDCLHSPNGYDPIQLIGRNEETGRFKEQDILRISAALCPVSALAREPYWEQAAQMLLSSLIALALERFTEESRTMETVCYLATRLGSDWLDGLFEDLAISDPQSFAVREYRLATINKEADKMSASVIGILVNALHPLSFDGTKHLYGAQRQVDIPTLGHKKTALFVTVSDNDRSLDRLVNVFYTQLIQELIREADRQPGSALPVPVRFILDDFATNTVIPDFDKIVTTIRSRGISVSLIVQDLTQLSALYGEAVGAVIANNCDTWLYLGGQDVGTAERLSRKLHRTADSILELGLDEAFLFARGTKPRQVRKYNLCADAAYQAIQDSMKRPDAPVLIEDSHDEREMALSA